MQVPLIDLKAQYQAHREEIDQAVARVLARGQYVMGEEVEAFEEAWAKYCQAKYCAAVSSGTDALYLTFLALSQPEMHGGAPPATVIPVRTFIATAEAALRANCHIALYDTLRHQPPSRAAVTVNLYGKPLPLGTPNPGGFTVEDAAQSHGVPLRADVATYSYYPTKNLGAVGQGGAVVTNNKDLAELVRILRSHGEQGGRFRHQYLSGNYRMDELQAAILRAKLHYLDQWNTRRREIAEAYTKALSGLPGITPPVDHPQHVFHIYALSCERRDGLAEFLKAKGIQTAVRYPIPLHLQPCLSHLGYKKGDFPQAEKWADTTLSLPIYPEMSDDHVEFVIKSIKEYANGNTR